MIRADVAQETEMTGWLAAENGDKVPLGGLCRIGREPSNDIILNTPAASRHHGLIHKRDDEFWIVDLGGINGIEVNGKRVLQPTRLQPGDRIQLPTVLFTFWQAIMPAPAKVDEKNEPSPRPVVVPGLNPVQRVEQSELMLTVDTVPLPAPVPPVTEKESEHVVQTKIPTVPLEEIKDLEQLVEPEVPPTPEPPVGEKETPSPPPLPAPKPQDKNRGNPKKPRPTLVREIRTPEVTSTNPQNMCVMAKRSMYIGLASIFLPFLGSISAMFAIVLGHKALGTIKKSKGALIGRDEAMMGLYFGYITLVLILTYSTVIYAFYFSSSSSPTAIANTPTVPTFPPAFVIPKIPNPPSPPPSATTTDIQNIPSSASTSTTPDNQNSPNSPAPTVSTDSQNIPNPPPPSVIPGTESTTRPQSPTVIPKSDTTQNQPLPGPAPAVHDPTLEGYVMKAPVSLREDPSTINTPEKSATPNVNLPAPLTNDTPAVFSPEVQTKLRDGMLAQPMPADSADRSYLDAEAFNNCARILARPPEAKYADSVKDFLDDVKQRNPDPARLQILTAMYANYLAALKDQ